ncbi:MAG: MFS transporter [Thiotrichales bacterium]|nr:MFS transporter [Thiotrichales bacterium]
MSPILPPLLAMTLVQAMAAMALVTVPVLAPEIAASLAIDTAAVGLHPSIAFAGAACLALLSGSLVLRYGGVRVNQASVVIAAAGIGLAIAGSVPAVALGAVLTGMGYGLATPGASHVLARVTPMAHRGFVFSVKQSAVPLGGLVAGVLFPPVAERFGWEWAILLACAMVLSAALIIQPLRARLDDDRDPGRRIRIDAPWQSVRLIFATPRLRPIALVAFSFGAMQLCLFGFFVVYLVERVGLDLVTAGLLFSVMQGAGFVARVGWGWVSDRWISTRPLLAVMGVGTIASTVTAIGFSDAWSFAGLAAASVALGVTAVGWNGIYLAEVSRAVPMDKVGLATGGALMFTFVGVVLGPSTFGAIVAATGSYAAAFITMDVLVLAAVVTLVLRPRTGG